MKLQLSIIFATILIFTKAFAEEQKSTDVSQNQQQTEPKPADEKKVDTNSKEQQLKTAPITSDEQRKWQFAVGLGYSLNTNVGYNITTNVNNLGGSADLTYSNVPLIEFKVLYSKKHAWGFLGGLTYDFTRQLTGGTMNLGGTAFSATSSDPSKIQITALEANAFYLWEKFYMGLGLNQDFITYTPPATFNGTYSVKGGTGIQLFLGVKTSENFMLEFSRRSHPISLTSTSSGITALYEGYMYTTVITGRYIFK